MSDTSLSRLLRGISTNDVQTVRSAWRELLDRRDRAVPIVRAKLASDVWREKPQGPSHKYLGVLLALLHELDPEAFKREIKTLRARPLHALHKHTVEIMANRRSDKVFGRLVDRVPVYISNEVGQPELVFEYLEKWSRTRDLTISSVVRVDVIALRPDMDYLGIYNSLFDGIVLTWGNDVSSGIGGWMRKTRTEMTFYHEVGHHYFKHSEGGQIEEQEKEANNYMRRMFRNAHPVLVAIGRVVFLPVIWIKRPKKTQK